MNAYYLEHIENLNHKQLEQRLKSLQILVKGVQNKEILEPNATGKDVNNHIHTSYSFSPYSPTKALWMAYISGLTTAGIMDHDSVAGAKEFIQAGKIMSMAITVGMEIRVDMNKTPLAGKKINNPDQASVVYMAMHGIPHHQLDKVQSFIRPFAQKRNDRNQKMVEKLNQWLTQYGVALDFEKEVLPLSQWSEGGSVTERHISYALADKMISVFGKGEKLVDFYKQTLGLPLKQKIEDLLMDTENPVYAYDLLGTIKSDMIDRFYIDATDECVDIYEAVDFANHIGAIPAYAYLGDIGDSVTGDKKPQKFEDDFLDALFVELKKIGFKAIAYMPSRNTIEQIERVKDLCAQHDLMEISGEDINSPRQKFVCDAMRHERFDNLIDSTWALIGHELKATQNQQEGLFSNGSIKENPKLSERIKHYGEYGKHMGGTL